MQIASVSIKNFKSIKEQTFDKFTDINMMFGQNNSGKSNALKFLDLFFQRKSPKLSTGLTIDPSRPISDGIGNGQLDKLNFWEGIISNEPNLFHKNNRQLDIEFRVELKIDKNDISSIRNVTELISLYFVEGDEAILLLDGVIKSLSAYDSEMSIKETKLSNKEIYSESEDRYFFSAKGPNGKKLVENGYEIYQSLLNSFNGALVFLDNDRYFVNEKQSFQATSLSPKTYKNWAHNISMNVDRHAELTQILRSVGQFKANGDAAFQAGEINSPIHHKLTEDFTFARENENINIYLQNSTGLRQSIGSYGTGIQQLIFILTAVAYHKPKIVLIEELELNLSPKYQYELLQHLIQIVTNPEKPLAQVFFTSHTPLLAYRSEFVVYKFKIDGNGETQIVRISGNSEILGFYSPEVKTVLRAFINPTGGSSKKPSKEIAPSSKSAVINTKSNKTKSTKKKT